ncbi:MAG: biotin-dependent carboxyltransferase family protein [Desulfobacterales bacterium]|nr:biotin-dependent carboxyltransferase family protein [Desulfobacterales bacterium]
MESVETLEILSPGPLTTVQDLGRYGWGRYGIPPSGALDAFSLRVANLLAGNPEQEAGLEITLMGLRVKALRDLLIAVTGGDLQPRLNGRALEMWRSHIMRRGDILFFAGPRTGCRAYLALGGGVSLPRVLGSKSTNLSSGFGGLEGRPLQKGDILSTDPPRLSVPTGPKALNSSLIPTYTRDWILRILPGPQDENFPEEQKKRFLSSSFEVASESDRTGIRMAGPPVWARAGAPDSIISEGVVPGAVQIPGDAQPIIILVETVTGGYRKIATVISADLPFLGQIKPGDRITFREVSAQEAFLALEAMESMIRRFKGGM